MSTVSFYYIGFALGIMLFFMPDKFGRRKSMLILCVPLIATNFILTYATQREIKAAAFFILGFLHIKITLCFNHCQEFFCTKYKAITPTVLTIFDEASIMIFALYLLFVRNDTHYILTYFFYPAVASFVAFIIWIPESPLFLFLKDPKSP
jgi:MFS family permease